MAVFTPVTEAQLSQWLAHHDVGRLAALRPIADGIENTNYFVDTRTGDGTVRHFVLTIVERIAPDELPFYLNLLRHLAQRGVPCPEPMPDRDGALSRPLHGKPATLVTRLPGAPRLRPDAGDVAQVGALLARMHLAAAGFGAAPANARGPQWWPGAAQRLMPVLPAAQQRLLADELAHQQRHAGSALAAALPHSAIHADLFRDNVLFDDAGRPGAIDFYFACDGTWMFDLAVVCNDWCLADAGDGSLDAARTAALFSGYRSVREPGPDEHAAWPTELRAAALRFWMSRLFDLHFPRPAAVLNVKDPTHFERILVSRRDAGHPA